MVSYTWTIKRLKKDSFVFKFSLLALFFIASSAPAFASFASTFDLKLTWEDPESGTGLHVSAHGQDKIGRAWTLDEVRTEDTEFYQNLFADTAVASTMGAGKNTPPEKIAAFVKSCVDNFAEGIPTGRMTIKQEDKPVGSVYLCSHETPGVGEIVRAFQPSAQGKGLGNEALRFIVEEWAPTVRQVGLSQNPDAPLAAVEKFQCFAGAALQRLYATARPSNPASWNCYKHFPFQPSAPTDQTRQISCDGWDASLDGSLEKYLVTKHFSPGASDPLPKNVLFDMLDANHNNRTLSFVEIYGSLRYHVELPLEPTHP